MKVYEMKFEKFPQINKIASMHAWGWHPAVWKSDDGIYGIRIKTGSAWSGNKVSSSYDYFRLDNSGLILESPRGMAKNYNKRIRITNMDEAVERYKEWHINE